MTILFVLNINKSTVPAFSGLRGVNNDIWADAGMLFHTLTQLQITTMQDQWKLRLCMIFTMLVKFRHFMTNLLTGDLQERNIHNYFRLFTSTTGKIKKQFAAVQKNEKAGTCSPTAVFRSLECFQWKTYYCGTWTWQVTGRVQTNLEQVNHHIFYNKMKNVQHSLIHVYAFPVEFI